MSNYVTSLELSRRLKELGVKQNSQFYWHFEGPLQNLFFREFRPHYSRCETASAFLTSELGEMLPNIGVLCYSNKLLENWVCVYATEHKEGFMEQKHLEYATTEADARAKMLIHLIEKGLVNAKRGELG